MPMTARRQARRKRIQRRAPALAEVLGLNRHGAGAEHATAIPPSPAALRPVEPGRCKCGELVDLETRRCARGHVSRGNTAALVNGAKSLAYWQGVAEHRLALVGSFVSDAGYTTETAPAALLAVADGLAQALLIRDGAFARLVEEGGAITSTGKARRTLSVWSAAHSAAERHARTLGLTRIPRPTSPEANLAARVATGKVITSTPSLTTGEGARSAKPGREATHNSSNSNGSSACHAPSNAIDNGDIGSDNGEDQP